MSSIHTHAHNTRKPYWEMTARRRTMEVLVVVLAFVALVTATKENYLHLEQMLNDPDFMLSLEKRLGLEDDSLKSGGTSDDVDSSPNVDDTVVSTESVNSWRKPAINDRCAYITNSSTIIKTKMSQIKGAFFLKSDRDITKEQCMSLCCATNGCNLAVYENKVNSRPSVYLVLWLCDREERVHLSVGGYDISVT
jgi:hypothetical protein